MQRPSEGLDPRPIANNHAAADEAASQSQATKGGDQYRSTTIPDAIPIAIGISGSRSRFASIPADMIENSCSRTVRNQCGQVCQTVTGLQRKWHNHRIQNVKQTTTLAGEGFAQSPISDYSGYQAFARTSSV